MIFWSNRVLLWNDVKQIPLWDCQQFWIQHVPIWEHPLEYSILSISCMPVQKTLKLLMMFEATGCYCEMNSIRWIYDPGSKHMIFVGGHSLGYAGLKLCPAVYRSIDVMSIYIYTYTSIHLNFGSILGIQVSQSKSAKPTCQVDPSCHGYISISLYIFIYIYTYLGNQHTSISTQWNASKYIIWSRVTPGSRKYYFLSVFVFLSLIKAQRIIFKNWKAVKNNDKQ